MGPDVDVAIVWRRKAEREAGTRSVTFQRIKRLLLEPLRIRLHSSGIKGA